MDDKDCWHIVNPEDLWVVDKLILAKRLGYDCGPAGVAPRYSGQYIVRPCVNFKMMSRGAHVAYLTPNQYEIPDGYFWCERFTGRHLSFDYKYGQQVLAVEGFRSNPLQLDRFERWEKINDNFILPAVIQQLAEKYEWLNVEVVGGRIIEVHFRYNDDFCGHDADVIYPVWKENFYESRCGDRIGFVLQSKQHLGSSAVEQRIYTP